MAITITRVTGLGGNPPTSIRVEGTSSGCEKVLVRTTCSSKDAEVPVVSGQWGAILDNVKNCSCGTDIEVTAVCTLGANAGDTVKFPLPCGDCPTVSISTSRADDCVNGKRRITVTVSVSPPLTATQALMLDFGDGTTGAAITVAGPFSYQHDYTPSPNGYTIAVTTILPAGCSAVTHHVDVPDCPTCCPSLSIDPPRVTDCGANASSASFQLNVAVPAGCTAPTGFNWTVTEQSSGRQWFRSGGTSLDTLSGWTLAGGGAAAAIDLNAGGSFSVAVVPAGNNAACNMALATQTFTVRRRCPRINGAMTQSSQDGCTFSFSVPADNPCNLPLTFRWTFGDGATATTQANTAAHTYAAGTNTAQTVSVTVQAAGCPNLVATLQVTPACGTPPPDCPPGQHRDANGNCVRDDVPPPREMSIGCWILLIIALVLAVVATVLGIVAACTANVYVGIAAGIVAALALVFLILWLVLCAAAACPVLLTVMDLVTFIIWLGTIVAALIAILGTPLCGLLAGMITWAYWGLILSILYFAARRLGCLRP